MKLLDLFCGAGGAAMGYHLAGFEVVGVDINPQPNYPFTFHQDDALAFLKFMWDVGEWDAIHASPPCQGYAATNNIHKADHPRLIALTREPLKKAGLPYIIENVGQARPHLQDPYLLCGEMFGLKTYRHRLFETSFPIDVPPHPKHPRKQVKMGRPVQEGDYIQVVGNFSGADYAREVMGTPWMTRDEMAEAIPPAYTEFIGRQLIERLERAA